MKSVDTITDLLHELSNHYPEIFWQLKCTYCDGANITIYEIALYEVPGNKFKGRLSFQLENDRVIRCNYKNFHVDQPDNIIDTLLDLINLEKQLHEEVDENVSSTLQKPIQ